VVACMTQVRRVQGTSDDQIFLLWGGDVARRVVFVGDVPLRRFFRFHAGSRVIPPASCKTIRYAGESLALGEGLGSLNSRWLS
jgi:hypothetical protein